MRCKTEESLGRQMYLLSQEMRNFAEKKVLKPFDITMEQLHIMKSLSLDKSLTQQAICKDVNKTPANITRILDRLENKGLVVRKDNPADRRACMVSLTDKGNSLVGIVEEVFESFKENFLENISVREQEITMHVLNKMSKNLLKMSEHLKNSGREE